MWIISYLSQAHANTIHLVCALAQPMFLQLQQGWGGWGQGWWLYGCDITIPVTVTVLTARLKAPLLSTGCEYSAVNCVLILSLSNIHIAANHAASMKINISLTFYNKWPKRAVVTMQWCCTHRSSEDRFSVFEQTAETCEANQTTTLRVRTNLKLILICVQHSWIKPWPPPPPPPLWSMEMLWRSLSSWLSSWPPPVFTICTEEKQAKLDQWEHGPLKENVCFVCIADAIWAGEVREQNGYLILEKRSSEVFVTHWQAGVFFFLDKSSTTIKQLKGAK